MKKLIPILFLVMICFSFVIAVEPAQKFNKIYLNPLYVEGIAKNEIVSYNLTVDTPDGISSVQNAMITFQVWQNPTVRYYLWVNGQTCNTESFLVHTTYANAGEGTIFFDCSNIITKEGNYTVEFQPDDDIGTVTGWVDLTYTNNPDGNLDIHGTEYVSNQNGTTFLQLRDNQGLTVDNGSCDLTVYYPDKTLWLEDVSMTYLNSGLYYYNFVTPDETGVYMVNIYCAYDTNDYIYSPPTSLSYDGNLKDGSTGSISEVEFPDGIFLRTDKGHYHQFNFIDNGIGNINLSSINNLKINWLGQNEKDGTYLQAYNFNTASWDNIGSSFIKSKGTDGDQKNSHGVSREITSNIQDYINGNEVRVRVDLPTDTRKILTDYIEIRFSGTGETVNDIRGSGEIHVSPKVWDDSYTPLENRTVNQSQVVNGINNIQYEVWNYNGTISSNILSQFTTSIWSYVNRTLTSFGFFNATTIAEAVWSYTTRVLTAFNFDVVDELLISNFVWNATDRNLTYYEDFGDQTNYSKIQGYVNDSANNITAQDIWEYSNRNLTYYEDFGDQTNYSLIQSLIQTYGNDQSDLTNYSTIEALILASENNISVEEIWEYSNRNLTYYEDVTNYTLIDSLVLAIENNITAQDIWEYVNRTLTYYEDFGDQTNYTLIEGLVLASENNISVTDIWGYANRNLTYYQDFGDQTNYTLIRDIVMDYANEDSTNYTLIEQIVTQYGNNNTDLTNYTLLQDLIVTYGNINTDLTNYSEIQDLIEQYANDDNTNYTQIEDLIILYDDDETNYTQIQDLISTYGNNNTDLTNYSAIEELIILYGNNNTDLTNYTQIQDLVEQFANDDNTNYTLMSDLISTYGNDLTAQLIWEYSGNRNLTYYQNFGDQTNYTQIQSIIQNCSSCDMTEESIWSYFNRTLTEFQFFNVTDIAQAIWNYTNRSINEFEFYIDASPQSVGQTIDFEVYSLLEISNYPVVEGQFTCYVEGYKSETEIIFNKAISKTTPYREIKTLNFPVGVHGLERIICNLDVLGTNDLQNIATDTFIASYSGEEPTGEVEPIINETEENVTLIDQLQNQTIKSVKSAKVEVQNNLWVYLTILGGFFLIIICFFLWRRKYGKD